MSEDVAVEDVDPASSQDVPRSVRPLSVRRSLPRDEPATFSARKRVLESRMPDPDAPPMSTSVVSQRPVSSLTPSAVAPRSPSPGATATNALRPSGPPQAQAFNVGFATPKAPTVSPNSRWVGRTPDAEALRGSTSSLSLTPRMTALFGGLFGLATVTTIVALLIQGSPPEDVRALASAMPINGAAPAESGAGSSSEDKASPASRKKPRIRIPGPPRVHDLAKQPGVRVLEDAMGSRSFIAALGEKGVPKDQIYRLIKAFNELRKFDKTHKKDRFVVALDRTTNEVRGFEFVVSPLEVYQALETNGILSAQKLDLKVAELEVSGSFYVGKNLERAVEWGGLEPDILRVIDEAFAGKLDHGGFEEGSVVRVIATEVTALGDFVRYKNVVAVEYQPPDPAAAPIRAYTYQGASAKGYFDDKGRQPDGSGWGSPVTGAPVTSKFNPKRMHPVLKKVMPHNGTDYGAPTGTPVNSVFRGKLTFVGNAGPCGNMVAIMHPNGIESGYCHLHKIAPGLKVGNPIGTRQLIGQVGTTGRSTGPHLHFWTKRDGTYFDSETLKIDGFRVLPSDERPAFALRKTELESRLAALPLPEPPPAEPPPESGKPSSASGDPAEQDEPIDAAPGKGSKKGPKEKVPSHKDEKFDPGDGEDLMGPDLKR